MLNWLNRTNSSAAATAGYPQPPLANWRNREKSAESRPRTLEPAQPLPRKRRFGLLELFSFAVVLALIVGVDLYIFGINKRLSALESQFTEVKEWAFPASLLEGKYASLNARVRALTDAYSGLNQKLALATAQQETVATIEPEAAGTPETTDRTAPAPAASEISTQQPAVTVATQAATEPETAGLSATTDMMARAVVARTAPATDESTTLAMADTDLPSEAPAAGITEPATSRNPPSLKVSGLVRRTEPQAARMQDEPARSADDAEPMPQSSSQEPNLAAAEEPAVPVTPAPATDPQSAPVSRKAGPWVINLLSDPSETLAARFADQARERGVTVEQTRTEVKGRVYWRVQITGFATAGEAQARAEQVKEKLKLKDVWVFKQAG
jgi:hypothetical protein